MQLGDLKEELQAIALQEGPLKDYLIPFLTDFEAPFLSYYSLNEVRAHPLRMQLYLETVFYPLFFPRRTRTSKRGFGREESCFSLPSERPSCSSLRM